MMWQRIQQHPILRQAWAQFIIFVACRFLQDRCSEQASSLTYTTLFSVVPMLTIFLAIVSSIKALEPARQQLQNWIYSNFLPKTTIAFEQMLSNFAEKSSNLTVIGSIFLFVTTILMIMAIEDAFNRIWRVKKSREFGFMRYWTIVSLGPLLLGTAFALSSTLASFSFLNNQFGYQINVSFFLDVLSFLLTIVGFFFLYWALPNRNVPWKSAGYAAIFAAIAFEILKNIFGWAMSNFTSYELVYGAFAALPIFLLWIYLSWNVILLGVQISYAATVFHPSQFPQRHPLFVILDILQMFYHKQKTGQTVKEDEILTLFSGKELANAPMFLSVLQDKQFIQSTTQNEYVLCRNLAQLSLYEFIQLLPYHFPNWKDINRLQQQEQSDIWYTQVQPLFVESHLYLHEKLNISMQQVFEPNANYSHESS